MNRLSRHVTARIVRVALVAVILTGVSPALAGDEPAPRLYWSTPDAIHRVDLDAPTTIDTALTMMPLGRLHDILVDEAGDRVILGRRGPHDIAVCGLDGSGIEQVVDTGNQGLGFDFDSVEGKVYWVQSIRVRRANIDGSDEEVIAFDDRMRSTDTTGVDIVNRKVYWTASGDAALRRADLDGSNVETVDVNPTYVEPAAMRVDGSVGRIFCTRLSGQLLTADLDGSNKISIDNGGVTNFTLDRAAQKVYWANAGTIYRANYDGTSIEDLFDAPIVAMGIRSSEGVLYAADEAQDGLLRYDIATGDRESLWNGIPQHVFGEVVIDSIAGKYYWADLTAINRTDFDGSRGQTIGTRDTRPESAFPVQSAIARDAEGRVYWYDVTTGALRRACGDGSNAETLVNLNLSGLQIGDLEIDFVNEKLYLLLFASSQARTVARMNLDGSQKEVVTTFISHIADIEIDGAAGHAYHCVPDIDGDAQTGRIVRTNLMFTNGMHVVIGNASPHSIAIDSDSGKIYWIDYYEEKPQLPLILRSANLTDGSGITDVVEIAPNSFGSLPPRGLTIETNIPAPEDACRFGLVNADAEGIVDVLLVNGSAGDVTRTVAISGGDAIVAEVVESIAGASQPFVVHANFGEPTDATVTPLPRALGSMCFPLLLGAGATPAAVWNALGKESQLGASTDFDGMPIPDPAPAPFAFLDLPTGDAVNLPPGTIVTFQGVVRDPVSLGRKPFSPTNAVILQVE